MAYFNMFATFFDAMIILSHTCNSIEVICLNVLQEYNDVKVEFNRFRKNNGLRKKFKKLVKIKNIKSKVF